ncbi:MAG: cobalamin B12-binding domain-containing protein [Deltaproteobacteria bacterium]|nr:cobalamin-dependent protein [bacterium]MCB9477288.1 cobalamin B12-binding domain-containing protein [Deltaproteobacteria bacterium]MCB9478754.1 cobalamin B12-binding domain-containing protein [Deltaproteobacteria bacterium]MCB9488270.1 cobalamin B12-binding domain-containing protein [Deltaproteobacteria bacterium]
MSKVLLFYPRTGWDVKNVSVVLPLSVMLLGRPLRRAGYKPIIIDQRIDHHWKRTLQEHLRDGDVAAVGVSAMTGFQIKGGLEASKLVRHVAPDVPIVWGGVHPSLLPMETIADPAVDYVVWGEGEESLIELLDALKDTRDPVGIPGVSYMNRHGEPVHGGARPFLKDLSDVLIPDYDLVDVADYITTQTLGERDLAIMTSRGCPSRCSFCYNVAYANRRWRSQPAEAVVDHIELITKQFGIDAILVKDDNFFVSKKRVAAIAEELNRRNVKVIVRAECRADYVSRSYDHDFLTHLYDTGFQEMTVGAESGTEIGLDILAKDISVENIREANRRLGAARIATKFTFMSGFPGETWESIQATLKLMLDLVKENPYARATPLHLYAPYPGTPLYDQAVRHGWTPPETLAGWAAVDFHEIDMPWIEPHLQKMLERMSVSTYFLDGRTMPEYFAASPMMSLASRVYGSVVRWRARNNYFRMMPELWLMEQYRKVYA